MVRNGHGRVLLSTSTPHGQPEPLAAPCGADAETTPPVTPAIATTTGDTEPGTSEPLLLGLDGDMLAAVSAALGLDAVLMMRATCRALAHAARRALRSEAWRGGALQMVCLGRIGEDVATGSRAALSILRAGPSHSSTPWPWPMAPKAGAAPTCLGACRSPVSPPELASHLCLHREDLARFASRRRGAAVPLGRRRTRCASRVRCLARRRRRKRLAAPNRCAARALGSAPRCVRGRRAGAREEPQRRAAADARVRGPRCAEARGGAVESGGGRLGGGRRRLAVGHAVGSDG